MTKITTQSTFVLTALAVTVTLLAAPFVSIASQDTTGNGAPSGAHYTLNIIGMGKDKTADMDGNNGHRIFVPLYGKAKIELQKAPEGESFEVLDANATDGSPAQFQLPDPGLDAYVIGGDMTDVDTMSDYSVFVRPLGKPGGWSTMTTCADIVESELEAFLGAKDAKALNRAGEFGGQCSLEQVGMDITLREKGKSTFENVTAELLTMVLQVEVDEDGDGIVDDVIYMRVPIFDDILENEYWEYDNKGLRVLQVRFYPGVQTDVSEGDDAFLPAD